MKRWYSANNATSITFVLFKKSIFSARVYFFENIFLTENKNVRLKTIHPSLENSRLRKKFQKQKAACTFFVLVKDYDVFLLLCCKIPRISIET